MGPDAADLFRGKPEDCQTENSCGFAKSNSNYQQLLSYRNHGVSGDSALKPPENRASGGQSRICCDFIEMTIAGGVIDKRRRPGELL
jgi:hypothetical protein